MVAELPLQANFLAFAVPGAIAAIAMTVFSLREQARHRQQSAQLRTKPATAV
jgi:AAHS family benzoate transporter-like MFS transporter